MCDNLSLDLGNCPKFPGKKRIETSKLNCINLQTDTDNFRTQNTQSATKKNRESNVVEYEIKKYKTHMKSKSSAG